MKTIQILGTGCPKCIQLFANAEEAVRTLGIEAEIVKVERLPDIVKFGVMMTPALAVDGVVKSAGKVLGVSEIGKLVSE